MQEPCCQVITSDYFFLCSIVSYPTLYWIDWNSNCRLRQSACIESDVPKSSILSMAQVQPPNGEKKKYENYTNEYFRILTFHCKAPAAY